MSAFEVQFDEFPKDLDSGKANHVIVRGTADEGITISAGGQIIRMSSRQVMYLAAAVRGRLVFEGIIREDLNPALGVSCIAGSQKVNFGFETPMQSWTYDLSFAKQLWRQIKICCEEAGR